MKSNKPAAFSGPGGTKTVFDIHGPGTQRALLEAEGVPFRLGGTVDLNLCRWDPQSQSD